ncbi:hypothetical protein HUJ05_007601, partial [Dendroctonus ponderosae]
MSEIQNIIPQEGYYTDGRVPGIPPYASRLPHGFWGGRTPLSSSIGAREDIKSKQHRSNSLTSYLGNKKRKVLDTSFGNPSCELATDTKNESPEMDILIKAIENIGKLSTGLRGQVEQNTKREIKDIAGKLEKQVEALNRSHMRDWLVNHRLEEQQKVHSDIETKSQARAGEICPTSKSVELICSSLENKDSYVSWTEVSKIRWDENLYTNTEVTQGNPLLTKTTTVKTVLIEPTDLKMEKGIQLMYKRRYPELIETDDVFAVLEQSSRWRKHEAAAVSQKITRILQGDQESDLWDRMKLLTDETKDDEWVAIHCIERCTTQRLRKMAEAIFHGETTKVSVNTNKKRDETQQTTRERPPALIVNSEGKSYLDMLKIIKGKLKDNAAAQIIKSIRETKNNNLIITTDINKAQIEVLKKAIEGPEGDMRVRDTIRIMESVHIRSLENTVTREDVSAELERVIGKLSKSDLKMNDLRPNAGSTQALTISLEKHKAELLLQKPYKRVGLSRAKMVKRINVPRCKRCWDFNHSEDSCTGPDRRNLCFRCGKEGHAANECKAKATTCLVCSKEHQMGTASCGSFRRALSQLRRQISRTPHTTDSAPAPSVDHVDMDTLAGEKPQEPNHSLMKQSSEWYVDMREDAALSLRNLNIACPRYGSGNCFVWIELPDFIIVSCYFSPSPSQEEFGVALDALGQLLLTLTKDIIIAGDFNAWATDWGMKTTSGKGKILTEWMAVHSLTLQNNGNEPTFTRAEVGSIVDLTMAR